MRIRREEEDSICCKMITLLPVLGLSLAGRIDRSLIRKVRNEHAKSSSEFSGDRLTHLIYLHRQYCLLNAARCFLTTTLVVTLDYTNLFPTQTAAGTLAKVILGGGSLWIAVKQLGAANHPERLFTNCTRPN